MPHVTANDALDDALMEPTIGLYKTELIKRCGPCKNLSGVEPAAGEYLAWYSTTWIHGGIGHAPPAEKEAFYYRQNTTEPQVTVTT
ncbi:hypothetical protein ACQEU6_26130 [Spirillospora sp. CA-108201]